jgi:hypothetical protein
MSSVVQIMWKNCERYEDAGPLKNRIYIYGWGERPFYLGKFDRSAFLPSSLFGRYRTVRRRRRAARLAGSTSTQLRKSAILDFRRHYHGRESKTGGSTPNH